MRLLKTLGIFVFLVLLSFNSSANDTSESSGYLQQYAEINARLKTAKVDLEKINQSFSERLDPEKLFLLLKSAIETTQVALDASRNLVEISDAANRLEAEKLLVDVSSLLEQLKQMLRPLDMLRELSLIVSCLESTKLDPNIEEARKKEFFDKINLEKLRLDVQSVLGSNHQLFLKIDSGNLNKKQEIDLIFNEIGMTMISGKFKDLGLQVKSAAILGIYMAMGANSSCVPSERLLNLMEQVPHANK